MSSWLFRFDTRTVIQSKRWAYSWCNFTLKILHWSAFPNFWKVRRKTDEMKMKLDILFC